MEKFLIFIKNHEVYLFPTHALIAWRMAEWQEPSPLFDQFEKEESCGSQVMAV
jgi:hypothetical protein